MKYSTINSLFTILFLAFAFLFFSNTAQAHDVEPKQQSSINTKEMPAEAKGGPRNIIQERTSIIVIQPTSSYLEIVIVDQTGNIVHESSTSAYKTVISTEGWSAGNYTVITTDEYGDVQDFDIIIE